MVITDRESISLGEFGSISKRLCSHNRGMVLTEFGRGNSVGRRSHRFHSCMNSSGIMHSRVSSRGAGWVKKSYSYMRLKRFCVKGD